MSQYIKTDIYKRFLDFIEQDLKSQRSNLNRRIFNVVFFVFVLPAVVSAVILLLIKLGTLPAKLRSHMDWFLLVIPVFYSLFMLGQNVWPTIFRRAKDGNLIRALEGPSSEGKWRDETSDRMYTRIGGHEKEWRYIVESFQMDLSNVEYRTRHLTALAGAVFFLLMQGIDSMLEMAIPSGEIDLALTSNTSEFGQYVGLGLFLILLYLSGSQNYQSLVRYLNCARLIHRSVSNDRRLS